MEKLDYLKDSIFRIGEVYAVRGREITVKVDHNKNLSHILYQGELIKNVSVGSYLKIKKGFCRLVAKVESEMLCENKQLDDKSYHSHQEALSRQLIVKVIGYFENGKYFKGIKEVPLIGDGCFLLDNDEFARIHKFASPNDITLNIGHLLTDENIPIEISIDKLFASHIGIFGNTGSGKSHTLASIYRKLYDVMGHFANFQKNARFVLFDFNGEYSGDEIITMHKQVYKIDTRGDKGDRLPLRKEDLYNPELLSILCSASEKTQQPFIRRTLKLLSSIEKADNEERYVRGIIKKLIKGTLTISDRVKAKILLDYFEQILPHNQDSLGIDISLQRQLEWFQTGFRYEYEGNTIYIDGQNKNSTIRNTRLYLLDELN